MRGWNTYWFLYRKDNAMTDTLTRQILRADTLRLTDNAEGLLARLNVLRSPKPPLTLQQIRQTHWMKGHVDVPLANQRTDKKPVRQPKPVNLFR